MMSSSPTKLKPIRYAQENKAQNLNGPCTCDETMTDNYPSKAISIKE